MRIRGVGFQCSNEFCLLSTVCACNLYYNKLAQFLKNDTKLLTVIIVKYNITYKTSSPIGNVISN